MDLQHPYAQLISGVDRHLIAMGLLSRPTVFISQYLEGAWNEMFNSDPVIVNVYYRNQMFSNLYFAPSWNWRITLLILVPMRYTVYVPGLTYFCI